MTTRDTLTVPEVAALLEVNRATVLRLVSTGRLPGAKIGRAWVFLRSQVDAFLQSEIKKQTARRRAARSVKLG